MSAYLFTDGKFQAISSSGPVALGKLYTWAAGGLVTPLATYTDQGAGTQNSNPVILDSEGRADVWLLPTAYRMVLTTAAGATIWDVDNITVGASSQVYFTQGGTGAVTRTVQERERITIYASDFYSAAQKADVSAGTGSLDITTALTAAITYAKTLSCPHLIIDPGVHYATTTVQFDLPNGSSIDFQGTIKSSVAAASAVVIGSPSAATRWLNVKGIKVNRSSIDYSGSSVGVELLNLQWCSVDVRTVTQFRYGLKAHGDGVGFTYNEIHLGSLHDNRTNLWLTLSDSAGGGYNNECDWFSGSLNHSTTFNDVTYNGVNLQIDYNAADPNNQLNNHRFWGISLEDSGYLGAGTNTVAAIINGENNVLYHPRLERPPGQTTYEIQFTVNATECGTVGPGFGMLDSNINDLGTRTEYETREGIKISKSTAASAAKAVLKLQSTNSSSGRLLQFLDASGVEQGYIDGNGYFNAKRLYNGESTFLRNTSTLTDVAAAATATLTNSPVAGNATKWVTFTDASGTYAFGAWKLP